MSSDDIRFSNCHMEEMAISGLFSRFLPNAIIGLAVIVYLFVCSTVSEVTGAQALAKAFRIINYGKMNRTSYPAYFDPNITNSICIVMLLSQQLFRVVHD